MTVGNSYYITVDGAQYWSIQKYVESEQGNDNGAGGKNIYDASRRTATH